GRPRERRPQSIAAKQVSMPSDSEVSTDLRAPRAQAGPTSGAGPVLDTGTPLKNRLFAVRPTNPGWLA
ncbi:unnamed protein product, partial [Pylaiella littoralis]